MYVSRVLISILYLFVVNIVELFIIGLYLVAIWIKIEIYFFLQ